MIRHSRRELNKLKCRTRILKASRKLFSAKGYENTTIEDVAEYAEISKATLYNYFPNKESLLIGIAEEELERVRHFISHDLKTVSSAAEKIRRVLEVFILDAIPYINLSRKITYLNSCETSPLYATRMDMIAIFLELVLEAQKQEDFRSDLSPDDIADTIMSIYLMAQFQWHDIDHYTPEFCRQRLNRILDIVLFNVVCG